MVSVSPSNPFSASKFRPGTIPFVFHDGNLNDLVMEFRQWGYRGQIVGPHGSGKTTLLLAVIRKLQEQGKNVVMIRLPAQNDPSFRQRVKEFRETVRSMAQGILAVDGWDQLSIVTRLCEDAWIRARNLGLLVTAHRPARLPVLARTRVTAAVASKVVAMLLENAAVSDEIRHDWQSRLSAELPEMLRRHHGNLREVLFELYDRVEMGQSIR